MCQQKTLNWNILTNHTMKLSYISEHRLIASELWSMVFRLFGVYWVMPKSVIDLLPAWQWRFGKPVHIVLCDVFGGRGMLEVLKTLKETYQI